MALIFPDTENDVRYLSSAIKGNAEVIRKVDVAQFKGSDFDAAGRIKIREVAGDAKVPHRHFRRQAGGVHAVLQGPEEERRQDRPGHIEKIAGGNRRAFAALGGTELQHRVHRQHIEAGEETDGHQADDEGDIANGTVQQHTNGSNSAEECHAERAHGDHTEFKLAASQNTRQRAADADAQSDRSDDQTGLQFRPERVLRFAMHIHDATHVDGHEGEEGDTAQSGAT
ncbi:MAG: hypothetical protein QM703_26125 [Gemmatales bacterium]